MFQDGRYCAVMPASETEAAVLGPHTRHLAPAITLRRATFRSPFSRSRNRCWPRGRPERRLQETAVRTPMSSPIPFPFNNFTCCFTLFSKCFSSFLHSTCSLSVSRQYLALDGIYHPLGAAFPNNSTRQQGLKSFAQHPTGLSPSQAPCSKGLGHRAPQRLPPTLYNSCRNTISNLSSCRFTRRYWGNPCWFLFLRLLICLSSAGTPT